MHPLCTRETKRCEFWNRGRDELRPPCCTAHLTELLFFVRDLLTRHNIFYWLDYGSLLGAIRSGDLIPWDTDADISCWRSDLPRIVALESEISAAGFWLDLRDAPYILRIHYSRINHMHVDLWMCHVERGIVKIHYFTDSEAWFFPVSHVEHLTAVTLCGETFPAPSDLDTFMVRYRYGPEYMTPQRVPYEFDWTHLPSLRDTPNTPLLEYLMQETRTYDYLISSAAPTSASNGSARQIRKRLRHFAAPLLPTLAKWVIAPTRRVLAYPFAVHYWLTQRRDGSDHPHVTWRDLSPIIALLLYGLYRRKRMVAKLKKQEN